MDRGDRILHLANGAEDPRDRIEFRNQNDLPRLNFRFGVDYFHPLAEGWFFKTGLRYTTAGYTFTNGNLAPFYGSLSVNPNQLEDYGYINRAKRTFHFMEIPLGVRYDVFTNHRWTPTIKEEFLPAISSGIGPPVTLPKRDAPFAGGESIRSKSWAS